MYGMYWVAYLIHSAKPISIRRLTILFVLVYVGAAVVLPRSLLHGKHPLSTCAIAEVITGIAWASPLIQTAFHSLRCRRLRPEALARASEVVQFTYGFALVACATAFASSRLSCRLTMGETLTCGVLGTALLWVVAHARRSRIWQDANAWRRSSATGRTARRDANGPESSWTAAEQTLDGMRRIKGGQSPNATLFGIERVEFDQQFFWRTSGSGGETGQLDRGKGGSLI